MVRQQWRRQGIRLAAEGLLIVFSVLLAFWLDGYRENLRKQERTRIALANIVAEIESNQRNVEKVMAYHGQVYRALEAAAASDPGQATLFDVLAKAAPEGVSPPAILSTAWETAQQSGDLQGLSYRQSYALSAVYRLQADGVEATWKSVRASLNADAFAAGVAPKEVRFMAFSFGELLAQEKFLAAAYGDALLKLK